MKLEGRIRNGIFFFDVSLARATQSTVQWGRSGTRSLQMNCPFFGSAGNNSRVNERADSELLRDYVERRSESAFAELVNRHVALVYSVALRLVVDAHLAEDVTQTTFAIL